jgi:hypothetical protein
MRSRVMLALCLFLLGFSCIGCKTGEGTPVGIDDIGR